MNSKPNQRWKFIDWVVVLLFLAGMTYVYLGFFHVDPRSGTMVKMLAWAARIGLPLIGLGVVYVYYGVRTKKIAGSAVGLLLVSLILIALLVYPVASYVYYGRSFGQNIDQYHPYLQLAPRAFTEEQASDTTPPLRIFCLGGSTTEYTDSQKRGWPIRLEENLGGNVPGRQVRVYNQGRQWYTSQHTLYNYITNLRQHRPDVLIVMHAINDLLINADFCYYSFGPFQDDYRHFHGPVYRLINRPTLVQTAMNILSKIWYHIPREVIETDHFPGLAPFERNLRALIDVARLDSVQVVLLTQPYLFKDTMTAEEDAELIMLHVEAVGPTKEWGLSTALQGMKQYNDVIRRVAQDENVLLIDLEKVIPKSLEYFHDDVHYREKTFDLIARHIAKALQKSEILH